MRSTLRHQFVAALFAFGFLAGPLCAQTLDLALTPGEDTVISGLSGSDHEIFARQSGGGWVKLAAALSAALPAEAEIDAISFITPTSVYFSLDANVILSGTAYADEDVIFWNGSVFAMKWDGSANGLPAEVDLDALDVTVVSPFAMIFSLDSDALLTVNAVPNTAVADEDLLTFVTASGFTAITFDGSAEGVPVEADLDAVDKPSATTYLFSFDIPAVIGALTFDDADIVQWDSGTTNFNASPSFLASGQGVLPEVDLRAAETSYLNTLLDDALHTGNNMLAQLAASHGFPGTFSLQNTGTSTWDPFTGYGLAVVTDTCALAPSNRMAITGGTTVPPGGSFNFSALLMAPASPGGCTLELRMVQDSGAGLFGPTLTLTPTIVAAVNNANMNNDTIPGTMTVNQSLGVGITVRNTGNTVWYAGSNYKLAILSTTGVTFPGTRVDIRPGDVIMPNTTYQFITQITAPGAPVLGNVQMQMVEETVMFFGQTLNKNVNVINAVNAVGGWEVYE